jgi:hypothetical protein
VKNKAGSFLGRYNELKAKITKARGDTNQLDFYFIKSFTIFLKFYGRYLFKFSTCR